MHRRVITFSRNIFLPLTTVCANACSYCCFKKDVADGCIMPPGEVHRTIDTGVKLGCTEALFTFGERPGEVRGFNERLAALGYTDILDYCYDLCAYAVDTGILPHTNAGILTYDELARLREVNASMGLMLETTADVPAHRHSPGKDPAVRIEMIENAGKLRIPFTTGILVGIGETAADREESLEVIAGLHRRYGHIQEVIVQNFCPKEGTEMAGAAPVPPDVMAETIRSAREILPDDIAVQIPPNLADAAALIDCGVDDLGGVSPLTIDYVNPEHPWPQIQELKRLVGDAKQLHERLCIYPRFIEKGWYAERLSPLIHKLQKDIEERSL